jgi:hypothetical protein
MKNTWKQLWAKWKAKLYRALGLDDAADTGGTGSGSVSDAEAAAKEETAQGFSHPAKVTCHLKTTSYTASEWRYTLEGCDWPTFTMKVTVQGEAHIYRKGADGKWVGGKYEWFRPGTSGARQMHNLVDDPKFQHQKPASGQQIAFVLLNKDLSQRTNAVFHHWKGA